MDSNVRILSGMQERQHNLSQSLNRAQEQKLYLESLLAQYRSVKPRLRTGPTRCRASMSSLPNCKQELADDQTKYTPTIPTCVRLKRLIARTEKQRDEIKANLAASSERAGSVRELAARFADDDADSSARRPTEGQPAGDRGHAARSGSGWTNRLRRTRDG